MTLLEATVVVAVEFAVVDIFVVVVGNVVVVALLVVTDNIILCYGQ